MYIKTQESRGWATVCCVTAALTQTDMSAPSQKGAMKAEEFHPPLAMFQVGPFQLASDEPATTGILSGCMCAHSCIYICIYQCFDHTDYPHLHLPKGCI